MSEFTKSRRVFISFNGDEASQIFSVTQNKNDGSIYFSAPNFGNIDWLIPSDTESSSPSILTFNAGKEGKLSLHGSGVTHVRPHQSYGNNEFSINGNLLKSIENGEIGLRHLATIFLSDPTHKPASKAGSRKTDYILSVKSKEPYVFVFWAIPLIGPHSVNIRFSFNTDEVEPPPPKSGWGGFGLINHGIVWWAYRTKHMDKWPINTQAVYHDGHLVPLFIGTGEGKFRLEYRMPVITFKNSEFRIQNSLSYCSKSHLPQVETFFATCVAKTVGRYPLWYLPFGHRYRSVYETKELRPFDWCTNAFLTRQNYSSRMFTLAMPLVTQTTTSLINEQRYFPLFRTDDNADAMIPVGTATTPKPIINTINVNNRPPVVMG